LDRWPSSADDGEPGPERGRSATLDVYVVVAGELVVGLDDGETTLRSGEVLGEEDDPIVALADAWETGGPVASVDQGGDATPPWQLEPRARGLKVLNLEMMPTDTGPGSGDEGWHATNTIDVDIVIDGAVELYLPELPPVSLSTGDILVQRATNHRWRATGDRHLRMVTFMIAVGP
jgi:quercetin dioxygenase-like cupin family protein